MAKTRQLLTNFSKGELSPLIEGRPDLAAYFEGAATLENFNILRQGGVSRRIGTRYVAEVKNSAKDTILIPFEADTTNAYVLEVGDVYIRFFKNNKTQLKTSAAGPPVEVVSPWTEAQLRNIHFTQSVDVMYLFHNAVAQRKLSRVSDTSWTLAQIVYNPPPSFEDDTDVSAGATLTPGATTGTSVLFTASSAVFLEADIGRVIVAGAATAVIVAFGASAGDTTSPNTKVRADIIDAFPNTNPIASGSWKLRLSPQTTLDPNKKEPVGTQVTLVAGVPAFRAADVGKFISVYGGLIKVTIHDSATQVKGTILSALASASAADPTAAAAGAWTLEIASWSTSTGFPRTGEFVQGRLAQASTTRQPTAFWMSASDDYEDYAVGVAADRAIEYTIASRALNQIQWLADNDDLFIGTAGSEHRATGGAEGAPLGGDVVPLVKRLMSQGCAAVQPMVVNRRVLFVDRSLLKLFAIAFELEEDSFDGNEITGAAEHIAGASGFRVGPMAFARRPDPRLYVIRTDGQLTTLTYFPKEKVIGFSRYVTDGTFESVAVIPQASGKPDQVWVIVKRTINGQTKRYVEVLDEDATELSGRAWTSLQTDCAKLYDLAGTPTTVLTGLTHLEAKTVDVVADGSVRPTAVVAAGQVTLPDAASEHVEIGLHYDSTLTTMRPAVKDAVVEGLRRTWIKLWLRLYNTVGGLLQNIRILYPPSPLNQINLHTGDVNVTAYGGPDTSGKVTVKQDQPYPMTVLALFGDIEFADHS